MKSFEKHVICSIAIIAWVIAFECVMAIYLENVIQSQIVAIQIANANANISCYPCWMFNFVILKWNRYVMNNEWMYHFHVISSDEGAIDPKPTNQPTNQPSHRWNRANSVKPKTFNHFMNVYGYIHTVSARQTTIQTAFSGENHSEEQATTQLSIKIYLHLNIYINICVRVYLPCWMHGIKMFNLSIHKMWLLIDCY